MKEYNIALIEKPLDEGLTKAEMMDLFDLLSGIKVVPVEFQGQSSTAMGLIDLYDADLMDYDYTELEKFVCGILDDMNNENPDCEYVFKSAHCDHTMWLSR